MWPLVQLHKYLKYLFYMGVLFRLILISNIFVFQISNAVEHKQAGTKFLGMEQ